MPSKIYVLPETLVILGEEFQVLKAKMKDAVGDTQPGHRKIRIDCSQHDSQDEVDSTLLHETIHAILHIAGVSNLIKEKEEEAIVVALEHGLHKLYVRRDLG